MTTFKCKSSQHVIDLLTKDFNSYGLSKYRYECDGIRSRLLTHEEFMLLCAGEPSNKKPSIDLCDLLSKKISRDELSLAKLKLKSYLLHRYRTCEEIIFRKVRLLGLAMDPFCDEKVAMGEKTHGGLVKVKNQF